MTRSLARFAFAVVFAVSAVHARGEEISTLCTEVEVTLNAMTSVSKLERCGDERSHEALLWHLDRIDQIGGGTLDGVADRGNGGAGSLIYIMDTGVMATHSEFASLTGSRVVAGFDAANSVTIGRSICRSENKATAPCYENVDELASASHGTGVASIAAGRNVGVAPQAMVVSIRVMNERGLATTRTYLNGLESIIHHAWNPASPNVRTAIVNISGWVLETLTKADRRTVVPFAALEAKMRDMIEGVDAQGRRDPNGKRFLFVVAANNVDGGCGPTGEIDRFPARIGASVPGMITVGGMTPDNLSWNGTCRGGVEVLAPAQSVFSATITAEDHYRGRRPNLRSGTSFAAPVIAGIAARLLSDRPDMTPAQLESWITATPSRVYDPSAPLADGRVAYVRSIAPAASTTARSATLEP